MVQEKRKSPRRAISRLAKIEIANGAVARDCLVTDISDEGVRLYIEGLDVPETFILLLGDDSGNIRDENGNIQPRDCQVIWRLGYELGVKFTDTPRRAGHSKTAKAAKQPATA